MVDGWEKDGVRPMVYMNPYFANLIGKTQIAENLFKDAYSKGFILKTDTEHDNSTSYLIQSLSIKFSIVDYFNPNAAKWAMNIINNNKIKTACSVSWMAKFEEFTPIDVKYSGFKGSQLIYHNRYIFEWTKAKNEAIAKAHKEDEVYIS